VIKCIRIFIKSSQHGEEIKGKVDNKINVLGVPVDNITMSEAIDKIAMFIEEKRPRLIVTPNAEMIMMAKQDEELQKILCNADMVLPDGAGVVWAARYCGYKMKERVAGCDLVHNLLGKPQGNFRVYLFGGAPEVVAAARRKIETCYPEMTVVGARNGFFSVQEEGNIVGEIKSAQPDILLVGLGVPKQEKWLQKHLPELNVPVSIGVGGTFDVMAGVVTRAPGWMQRAGLEWLYRLLLQPKRFMRMLALPRFVFAVMKNRGNLE
jgi:N-acetylglucosaminyldiphosphoundecaprenol N-acetyl-beta-D-mannosaminyltransferase